MSEYRMEGAGGTRGALVRNLGQFFVCDCEALWLKTGKFRIAEVQAPIVCPFCHVTLWSPELTAECHAATEEMLAPFGSNFIRPTEKP